MAKSRMPQARELIGKTIVGFKSNPSPDGRGSEYHDPCILLSDGSTLHFVTEETEVGEYGTFILRVLRGQERIGNKRHGS